MDDEIVSALIKIKNTCTQSSCRDCPFSDVMNECILRTTSPQYWDINDTQIIKYFK